MFMISCLVELIENFFRDVNAYCEISRSDRSQIPKLVIQRSRKPDIVDDKSENQTG